MRDQIQIALAQAEALQADLQHLGESLGKHEGEQLTEAKTEQQLDRWVEERGLGESMDAAVGHMEEVLAVLQRVHDALAEERS